MLESDAAKEPQVRFTYTVSMHIVARLDVA